jgi:hypothetical protein
MTTPAREPGLTRADPSGAIEGTAMPLDVEQEVLFADGSWDLVIVRSQAAGRCGGPAGRSFWRWRDWGVGEGSGTGRPTMMGQGGWAVRPLGKTARRCLGVRIGDGSG